jgi:two-component system CheB/CheR fusion protein
MQALLDGLQRVCRAMGELHLQTQPVDLRVVLDAAMQETRTHMEARQLRLACNFPVSSLMLQADPNILAQAFVELFHNTSRYSDPGGQITVSTAVEETQVILRVCHEGVGIAPDVLPHIFDLFVRGETTFDFAAGHFGAGLTLVRRIVEAHHGDVVAHSRGPGFGSEFVVCLPRAAAASSL